MTTKRNSFIGIDSGTGVTTGNSGGTSGDAFDTTVISAGCSVVCNTSADLTDAYDRGIICTVDGASERALVGWTISGGTHYVRFYYKTPATAPTASIYLCRFMATATQKYTIKHAYVDNRFEVQDGVTGVTHWTTALSTNTIYRVECKFTATGSEWTLRVAPGETTSYLSVSSATPTTATGLTSVQFGCFSTSSVHTAGVPVAAVAWSDSDWIGPAQSPVAPATVAATASVDTSGWATRDSLVVMGGASKTGRW